MHPITSDANQPCESLPRKINLHIPMPTPSPTESPTRAELFSERLAAVPREPGVYTMRGKNGQILYVGKSVSLRNRLRSYFSNETRLTGKTKRLVKLIHDFDYIVAESEREALLLENSLIKQHKPRFNARLKDDKTYPYIKVDLEDDFPRVYFTRRRSKRDRARYFGPYASAYSVRTTLDLLKKLFPYRSCTMKITGEEERPCLEYHIKRCVAPCTGYADQAEYAKVIDQVISFLQGDTDKVVVELQESMSEAADNLEFERAAALRDRLNAMRIVYEDQKVVGITQEDIDVIACEKGSDEAWIDVFFIRRGSMVGRDNFIMTGTFDDPDSHIIAKFIEQFYIDSNPHMPRRILTQTEVEDVNVLEELLTERRGAKMEINVPKRGPKRKLVDMARENAVQGLAQLKLKWQANSDLMARALEDLQEALSLPAPPYRIECYDISHIQGTSSVAAMSVFENGSPATSQYRRFKINTVEGNDDFASMREVLTRRFKRLNAAREKRVNGEKSSQEADSFGIAPDLVLIDGGKGQLSSALATMLHLGVADIPLASIAKKDEEIFVPDSSEPIVLPRNAPSLFVLQQVRDEAHRFAITYHRKTRGRTSLKSALDLVPGIGPSRKRALMRRFGSVKAIREATELELASTPGMTQRLAEKVKDYL